MGEIETGEPDAKIMGDLRARVRAVAHALVKCVTPGAEWVCPHCGQQMPGPKEGEWLELSEVRAQAQQLTEYRGSVVNLALFREIEDGRLEMDDRFRVRLIEESK